MTEESTLNYRRLDLESDIAGLVDLLTAVEQTDQTGEDVSEAALREQLSWSGQDPALNNWVVTPGNSVSPVGFGMIQKTPVDPNADVYIAVHPSWRRRQIGSWLFAHLLERATKLDTQALRVYVPVPNQGAALFVSRLGFEPISTFTRLSVAGSQSFPDRSALPLGFTVQTYDRTPQVDVYTEAMNQSYAGYWGHLQCTTEEVARFLAQREPAGIFLLFAQDGTIAGTCRVDLREPQPEGSGNPTAVVDAPGIVHRYRQDSLALPLLLHAIRWLLPQQPSTIELEAWGETPDMLLQYRSLGFSTTREEISYRRNLK